MAIAMGRLQESPFIPNLSKDALQRVSTKIYHYEKFKNYELTITVLSALPG